MEELIQLISRAWEIKVTSCHELEGSSGSTRWSSFSPMKISTEENTHFVFRQVGCIDDSDKLYYTVGLIRHLMGNEIPVPTLMAKSRTVGDEDDDFLLMIDRSACVLERFIDGVVIKRDTRVDPNNPYYEKVDIYYRSLGLLGARFNKAVSTYHPLHSHRWKTRTELGEMMSHDFLYNVKNELDEKNDLNRNELYFIEHFEDIVERYDLQLSIFKEQYQEGVSPDSHIHNDMHFGNVLFNEDGTEVTGLIDFDIAQQDARNVELNNMIMGISEIAPIDPIIRYHIDDISKIFTIIIQAYIDELGPEFSNSEISASWEVIRQRILHVYQNNIFNKSRKSYILQYPEHLPSLITYLSLLDFPINHPFSQPNKQDLNQQSIPNRNKI